MSSFFIYLQADLKVVWFFNTENSHENTEIMRRSKKNFCCRGVEIGNLLRNRRYDTTTIDLIIKRKK